jgi:alkylation response protein AidB-like acyl-CoA dehydrogenase
MSLPSRFWGYSVEFALTPEQTAWRDAVRRYCEKHFAFDSRRASVSAANFDRGQWRELADLGWLGAGLSEAVGGYGGSVMEDAILLEEIGRASAMVPLVPSILATRVLIAAATKEQRDKWLPLLLSGEQLFALAYDEPGACGLCAQMDTRAIAAPNRAYRLIGRKSMVLGGAFADRYLVAARICADDAKEEGVGLFIVDRRLAGVTVQAYRTVDNHQVCDLQLENAMVDAQSQLGDATDAFPALELAVDYGAIALCAEAVGAMDAALWLTRDYVRERRQFGVTIGSFQALQHRMADMLVSVELARSILYLGLTSLHASDPETRRRGVSAAKVQVSDAGLFVGQQAIQLHGGIGVTQEHRVSHLYRRLFVTASVLGDVEAHLERFSRTYSETDAGISY